MSTGMAGRLRTRAAVVATLALVVAWMVTGFVNHRWARPRAGTIERQILVDGVKRTYLLHAGGGFKPGRSLVLVLHGMGGTAKAIEERTLGTFDRLADRDAAVVVYPEALGTPRRWNDGWWQDAPGPAPADDVRFLSTLIDFLVAQLGVDRERVFAAGLSNGASMVHRLACERPSLVAAVAPVSGGMSPLAARACAGATPAGARLPSMPVSVIAMHGTKDPIVPLDQTIRDGIATWVKRDGCPPAPRSSPLPDTDPRDGTRTTVDLFAPCAADSAVAFYTIEDGGHAWPGGISVLGLRRRGTTPRDFDAGVVVWDFFQQHARR